MRIDEGGAIDHVIDRGNARTRILHKQEDYDAFFRILAEGLKKYSVERFAFTLMPNHWHLVLRPPKEEQMGRLLRSVTATHSLRYHGHYHTRRSRYDAVPFYSPFSFDNVGLKRNGR